MSKAEVQKRIDEEIVCADCFAHCLKHQYGCGKVTVERQDDDPPDFWITVDGIRFAAEVTSVVTGQAYGANARKLKRSIAQSAKEEGALSGTYALIMMRHPRLPRSGSGEWRALVAQATSFIRATRQADSSEQSRLLADSDGHLDMKKVSSQSATVGLLGTTSAKWEGEIQDELRALMQTAADQKRVKLEKKGVPSQCPRVVLLLYDAYGFGDLEDAQKALLDVDGYDWFHSVFWAASFTDRPNDLSAEEPGRKGAFLYSRKDAWWRSPTMGST